MSQIDRRTAILSAVTAGLGIPLVLASAPAVAQGTPAASGDQVDYVTQTLTIGTVSLRSSEVAAQKATNPMVREFAELEAAEQQTIAGILSATEAGQAPPALPPEEQAKIDELEAMQAGAGFDSAYVDAQLQGHARLLEVQQMLSGQTEATVEAITARLAEQAVASHIAMLNHIRQALDSAGTAPAGNEAGQPAPAAQAPAEPNAPAAPPAN